MLGVNISKKEHFSGFLPKIGLVLALLSFSGCGLDFGAGGTFNEPAPEGTVILNGTFQSVNATVTGVVKVYNTGAGTWIVRLESLSAPSEAGMVLRVSQNGNQVVNQTLKSTSGNQNYTANGATSNTNWSNAEIHSTTNGLGTGQTLYGTANLL